MTLGAADRDRLLRLPVANVADAMDRFGVMHAALGPVWRGARIVAPAFTVQTTAGDNRALHEAIDQAQAGDVLVVDGQGFVDRALIGELMAARAAAAGIAGFVIDGAVRDVTTLESLRFPVFARAVTPAGPRRSGPGRLEVPVAVGGVVVVNGDVVVADDDGVAVIPRDELATILERAEAKFDAETAQRAAIGSPA